MSSLRNSHPFFKNRINKYSIDEVKTWVDVSNIECNTVDSNFVIPELRPVLNNKTLSRRDKMRVKYNIHSSNTLNQAKVDDYSDTLVETPLPTINSYYNNENNSIYNNSIIITVENELQGLYCEHPKFNYKTANNDGMTHLNVYITCNKCEICIARRGLHIMKSIFAKFELTDVPTFDLYKTEILLNGLTAAQMTNKIRYRFKKAGIDTPDWLLHTTDKDKDTITYLTEGIPSVNIYAVSNSIRSTKITKDKALQIVKPGNKYRFMGKFYGKLSVRTTGLTQEEIEELKLIKPVKSKRCGCGLLWTDHDTKGAKPYDLFNLIEPADHYKKDHELFKDKYDRAYVIPNHVEK